MTTVLHRSFSHEDLLNETDSKSSLKFHPINTISLFVLCTEYTSATQIEYKDKSSLDS